MEGHTEKQPAYDLTNFTIRDMTECGKLLRMTGEDTLSMEEVAGKIVGYLFDNLRDGNSGKRACALVRFFKTHDYAGLDAGLQHFARAMLGSSPPVPDMKCLVLLATAGEKPEWGHRQGSKGHQAIPLPSEEAVRQIPMINNLAGQFGLELGMLVRPNKDILLDVEQKNYNVFHVPDAVGSLHIPAQEGFVIPHRIRSVIGFGGILPSGNMFSVIMFLKVAVPHEIAELFRTVALNVKMAVLPFEYKVFGLPTQPPG